MTTMWFSTSRSLRAVCHCQLQKIQIQQNSKDPRLPSRVSLARNAIHLRLGARTSFSGQETSPLSRQESPFCCRRRSQPAVDIRWQIGIMDRRELYRMRVKKAESALKESRCEEAWLSELTFYVNEQVSTQEREAIPVVLGRYTQEQYMQRLQPEFEERMPISPPLLSVSPPSLELIVSLQRRTVTPSIQTLGPAYQRGWRRPASREISFWKEFCRF